LRNIDSLCAILQTPVSHDAKSSVAEESYIAILEAAGLCVRGSLEGDGNLCVAVTRRRLDLAILLPGAVGVGTHLVASIPVYV
jgi:hypothetical protein